MHGHAGKGCAVAAAARGAADHRPGPRTSQLWDEGVRSSYFLPVKMSTATKWHLAWPCLPVLEVATSTTWAGQGSRAAGPWRACARGRGRRACARRGRMRLVGTAHGGPASSLHAGSPGGMACMQQGPGRRQPGCQGAARLPAGLAAWQRARSHRTLHGLPLMTMKPFLRMVPACWGYVREAPASADSNVSASSSSHAATQRCVGRPCMRAARGWGPGSRAAQFPLPGQASPHHARGQTWLRLMRRGGGVWTRRSGKQKEPGGVTAAASGGGSAARAASTMALPAAAPAAAATAAAAATLAGLCAGGRARACAQAFAHLSCGAAAAGGAPQHAQVGARRWVHQCAARTSWCAARPRAWSAPPQQRQPRLQASLPACCRGSAPACTTASGGGGSAGLAHMAQRTAPDAGFSGRRLAQQEGRGLWGPGALHPRPGSAPLNPARRRAYTGGPGPAAPACSDTIRITGARFYGYHGVLPEVGGGCACSPAPACRWPHIAAAAARAAAGERRGAAVRGGCGAAVRPARAGRLGRPAANGGGARALRLHAAGGGAGCVRAHWPASRHLP